MRHFVRSLILRWLFHNFRVVDFHMTEEEKDAALIDFHENESLQKLINIQIANLMRQNLYTQKPEEAFFTRGKIAAYRELQKAGQVSAEAFHKRELEAERIVRLRKEEMEKRTK